MQKSTILLLIMALASAGVSAGLWMQLRAERAHNADLTERLKVAAATPVAAPQPITNLPAEPPAVIPPAVASAIPASTSAPAEPAAAKFERRAQEDWRARQRRLMDDPKYREAFREQERLRLATRRENFIRLLGFSPEQADAVIDLSIERQMAMQDRTLVVTSEDGPRQQKERLEAEERAYQAKLRDLLGEEKSAQLQSYMESRQTRMQVDRFRIQLTGNDLLRDDQVEPLIAALHGEQSKMQQEMQEYRETLSGESDAMASSRQLAERQTELMKAAHGRMHSAASGILSSAQLEKLDAMLKRDLERLEAQQRMSRIQSKIEQPGVVETPPR